MNDKTNRARYAAAKASEGGKVVIINMANDEDVQAFRNQHQNTDLFVSVCSFNSPELSAPRTYPLYFRIASSSLEKAQRSTLEAVYYLTENFSIPEDCIEVIYNSGGFVGAGNSNGDADDGGDNYDGDSFTGGGRMDSGKNATDSILAAEMIILIPPVVFNGRPLPFMQALNYRLARQLAKDGTKNINTDVYEKEHFLPLPNSINSDTGRFIIPLQLKELIYLDAHNIDELSKQPRAEDSMIMPLKMPEAVEWFNEVYEEEEKQQQRQKQLQELVLKQGWQIPPCIRRLTWMDLSKEQAFEACRIISQFYSWIKASPDEIWHHFQQLDYRNHIGDYKKQKAIIAFALENPGFVGCQQHPLLKQFCPAGKCFIAELIDEYEKPHLFQPV